MWKGKYCGNFERVDERSLVENKVVIKNFERTSPLGDSKVLCEPEGGGGTAKREEEVLPLWRRQLVVNGGREKGGL